jgi:hypothetical protein
LVRLAAGEHQETQQDQPNQGLSFPIHHGLSFHHSFSTRILPFSRCITCVIERGNSSR